MKLAKGVVIAEADEGMILLDGRRGRYWHLNETGLRLLRELISGKSLEESAARVATEFGADEYKVVQDCRTLVRDLAKAKLVRGARP